MGRHIYTKAEPETKIEEKSERINKPFQLCHPSDRNESTLNPRDVHVKDRKTTLAGTAQLLISTEFFFFFLCHRICVCSL